MKHIILRLAILLLFVNIFFLPSVALSDIVFQNGFWSSTFDCDCDGNSANGDTDWLQYSDTLICDGISKGGDRTDCNGNYEKIWSTSNMSAGRGGKGNRWYFCPTKNSNSGSFRCIFTSYQPEFWSRIYFRYKSGTSPVGQGELKTWYLFTNGSYNPYIDWPWHPDSARIYTQWGTNIIIRCDGCGWATLYGGSNSDESWHYVETHVKLNTAGSNDGIFQMWIDGTLIIDNQSLAHIPADGTATAFTGFGLKVNHDYFSPAGWMDVDDIAIATPSYTGFVQDAQGNDMIGPIRNPFPPTGLRIISVQ